MSLRKKKKRKEKKRRKTKQKQNTALTLQQNNCICCFIKFLCYFDLSENDSMRIWMCEWSIGQVSTDALWVWLHIVPPDYTFRLPKLHLCIWGVNRSGHYTRYRVRNSSAVDNCYWAVLKLFIDSSVCKYSHQNNTIEIMALSSEIFTNPCVLLWRLTTSDTKSFIPDNTNDIDNLGEYSYSKA